MRNKKDHIPVRYPDQSYEAATLSAWGGEHSLQNQSMDRFSTSVMQNQAISYQHLPTDTLNYESARKGVRVSSRKELKNLKRLMSERALPSNDCYRDEEENNYKALMALRTQCPLVR